MRYGLPLFADIRLSDIHGTNGLMKEIQVEINRGLRIVLGVRLADKISIADLSAKVGVPSINQLAAEVTLMEIWKTFQMDLPASSSFVWLDDYTERTTRNSGRKLLSIPAPGGSQAGRFIRNATTLWNIAPEDIRNSEAQKEIKLKVRQFSRELPL